MRDGAVHEFGTDGDEDMGSASFDKYDAQNVPSGPLRPESFDGTASSHLTISPTAGLEQEVPVLQGDWHIHRYDADGDVIMEDQPYPETSPVYEDQGWSHESIEAVAFLYHREGNLYRSSHRSDHSYESIGSDFIEGLTGVTGIDVEIR